MQIIDKFEKICKEHTEIQQYLLKNCKPSQILSLFQQLEGQLEQFNQMLIKIPGLQQITKLSVIKALFQQMVPQSSRIQDEQMQLRIQNYALLFSDFFSSYTSGKQELTDFLQEKQELITTSYRSLKPNVQLEENPTQSMPMLSQVYVSQQQDNEEYTDLIKTQAQNKQQFSTQLLEVQQNLSKQLEEIQQLQQKIQAQHDSIRIQILTEETEYKRDSQSLTVNQQDIMKVLATVQTSQQQNQQGIQVQQKQIEDLNERLGELENQAFSTDQELLKAQQLVGQCNTRIQVYTQKLNEFDMSEAAALFNRMQAQQTQADKRLQSVKNLSTQFAESKIQMEKEMATYMEQMANLNSENQQISQQDKALAAASEQLKLQLEQFNQEIISRINTAYNTLNEMATVEQNHDVLIKQQQEQIEQLQQDIVKEGQKYKSALLKSAGVVQ